MITTCSQLLYASSINLIKRMSILRLQMNGERKHEYDPVENHISEIAQDWNNITGYNITKL